MAYTEGYCCEDIHEIAEEEHNAQLGDIRIESFSLSKVIFVSDRTTNAIVVYNLIEHST